MKQYIHVTKDVRKRLLKVFDVSSVMVWKGLTFDSTSMLGRKIRKYALDNGGILMNELPVMETLHDHDGYIRQYLPNDVMLEFNKQTGECDAFLDGELKKHWNDVKLSEIEGIQNWAASLK